MPGCHHFTRLTSTFNTFIMQELLNTLVNTSLPVDQRAAVRQIALPVVLSKTPCSTQSCTQYGTVGQGDLNKIALHSSAGHNLAALQWFLPLQALRPLVAAAGLDPEGLTDPSLHSGAVLFALTDAECAKKVTSTEMTA
jgi:hypothetical protein